MQFNTFFLQEPPRSKSKRSQDHTANCLAGISAVPCSRTLPKVSLGIVRIGETAKIQAANCPDSFSCLHKKLSSGRIYTRDELSAVSSINSVLRRIMEQNLSKADSSVSTS